MLQFDQAPTYTVTCLCCWVIWGGKCWDWSGSDNGVSWPQTPDQHCLRCTRGGQCWPVPVGGVITLLTLVLTPWSWPQLRTHTDQAPQAPSSQSWPHLTAHSRSWEGLIWSLHCSGSVRTRGHVGKRTQDTFLDWRPQPHLVPWPGDAPVTTSVVRADNAVHSLHSPTVQWASEKIKMLKLNKWNCMIEKFQCIQLNFVLQTQDFYRRFFSDRKIRNWFLDHMTSYFETLMH